MSFNIDAAKKAGYSQAEINDFLAGQKKFDVESAKDHGYSDEEIYDFLSHPGQKEEKEPLSTEISRTAAQLPLGALEGTPFGIATNLWQMMGLGESLSELDELEERLPDLKKKFPHLDWPEKIDREKYMKSVEQAVSSVPSIQNLAKYAEENTGLPLQAKTDLQKGINFFSSLAGFGGGSIPERFMTGFKGEIMKEALQHAGVPEPISEAMSIYHALHEKTPKINVQKAGKEVEGAAKELAEREKTPEGKELSVTEQVETQLTPEEAKLTAPQKYLKSDFELAEDIQNALSPLRREQVSIGEAKQPATIQRIFSPISEELNSISRQRINDPNLLGNMSSRKVKEVSDKIYKENTRLWNEARELASQEIEARPDLANRLRAIRKELPPPTRGGDRQLHSLVNDLLNRLIRRREGEILYRPISNAHLIDAIRNARVGYNYKYVGGVQGHQVNEFIKAVEDELIASSSGEARVALKRARQAHTDWATRFKHPQVLPFRNEKISTPQSNYEKLMNPDVFNIINPILLQDEFGKGRILGQLLKRNMLEKELEPFMMRPQSFNPIKFEREMGKLKGIIPNKILDQIGQKVVQNHAQSLIRPSTPLKGPTFANISESQIQSKLKTIEGLRQLKKELFQVPGGKELYEQVAKTQGIDLLFGGQLDISSRADRIKKILNDRNGRPYIRETLGEENLKVLDELVEKNDLEKRLLQVEESPRLQSILKDPDILIRGSKVVYNILKGNAISTINNAVQTAKKIVKHLKGRPHLEEKLLESNIVLD